jgi:biotin transport system permease protein
MIVDLYVFGNSPLHRTSPSYKILALVLFCTLLFVLPGWAPLAVGAILVALGYWLAGIEFSHAYQAIRPALWILAVVLIAQIILTGLELAAFVVVRFGILIMAASVITMTTKTSEFVDGIRAGLRHAPSWAPADHIALAISLALRFIPLVRTTLDEVRMAQRARGLDGSVKALLVPLVV